MPVHIAAHTVMQLLPFPDDLVSVHRRANEIGAVCVGVPLHQLLQQMITMGLSTPARQRNIAFAADLAQIRAILEK